MVSICKWWSICSWILLFLSVFLLNSPHSFLAERNYYTLKAFEGRLSQHTQMVLRSQKRVQRNILWKPTNQMLCQSPPCCRQNRRVSVGTVEGCVENFPPDSCLCFLPWRNKLCVSYVTDELWWMSWEHIPLSSENITVRSSKPWSQERKAVEWKKTLWFFFFF